MIRNIESFLEYMVVIRGASQNTLDAYHSDLVRFAAEMESKGAVTPDQVTEEMVSDYFFAMEHSDVSVSTLSRHMSAVRAFFRFLVENDDVGRNVTDVLKQPKLLRKRPQTLTTEEVERLLSAPDSTRPMGQRDRAILELMYASGLKVSELVALYPSHIDLRTAIVRVERGEDGMSREIPFGEKARNALVEWIAKGREHYVPALTEAPLFVNVRGTGLSRQSVWKLVRHYAEEAGIRKEITPGSLRHSFAAHLMENGADARSLTRMMGFASEAQTVIYESDEDLRLREVYERAQKRG